MRSTKYSTVVVEAAYERLHDEVFNGDDTLVDLVAACESTNGDPSFIPAIARSVRDKLIVGEPLSRLDRLWLSWVLDNIVEDDATVRAVSGKRGRGKAKTGARSIRVAEDVLDHIIHDPDTHTVSAAWEKVAARQNLSIDRVRECWAERKEDVCCSRQSELGLDGPEDVGLDGAIAAVLRAKMGK